MRAGWVALHRVLGLATAGFLFLAGLTGALIAWDRELDAWLFPAFYEARSGQVVVLKPAAALALARRVEAADPRLRVRYLPLDARPGRTLQFGVSARTDPRTGHPHVLGFDQVAVDPATGEVQARRLWGRVSLAREDLMPFLYKLHYSLHLPVVRGIDLGAWVLGLVSALWAVDVFVALGLSFPSLRAWRRSFAFRLRRGGHALNFDLHRSGGLWVWGLLLVMALTSLALNLKEPVVEPVVRWFSPVASSPFVARAGMALPAGAAEVGRERVLALAQAEAARRGWTAPPGGLFETPSLALTGVGFYAPEQDRGERGLGPTWLYLDLRDGRPVGETVPGEGSAGDVYLQAQYPLHSGRIAGVAGRAVISVLGVAVAMLSVTGVLLWWRKRRARQALALSRAKARRPAAS